jgi:DNA-binding transcriptional regulator YhcF (GntR family)
LICHILSPTITLSIRAHQSGFRQISLLDWTPVRRRNTARMKPFLHEKLTKALLAEMASGYYSEGTRFLSRRKICNIWNVSEPTAKNSLRNLVQAALLTPSHRSGSILTPGFQRRALLILHKVSGTGLVPARNGESKRMALLRGQRNHSYKFSSIIEESNRGFIYPPDTAALHASPSFF